MFLKEPWRVCLALTVIGIAVFAWAFPEAAEWFQRGPDMRPSSSIMAIAAGVMACCMAFSLGRYREVVVAACAVWLLACVGYFIYSVWKDPDLIDHSSSSIGTYLGFGTFGIAGLVRAFAEQPGKAIWISRAMLVIPIAALIGYAIDAPWLYWSFEPHAAVGMSILTSVCLICCGAAVNGVSGNKQT